MKRSPSIKFILFILLLLSSFYPIGFDKNLSNKKDLRGTNSNIINDPYRNTVKTSISPDKFSTFDLDIEFNEDSASVDGNLTLELYNNDERSFDRIPFHLYLAGMQYIERPGNIEIYSVSQIDSEAVDLSYEITQENQILWVTLDNDLKPDSTVTLDIDFKAFLPDGGIDRANFHGSDENQTKIYKFSHFYPIPAVYDSYDGWNNDSYLSLGDPFYFDMGYYSMDVEIPDDMVIAATGRLVDRILGEDTIVYNFEPLQPVREITFSVSRYFLCESKLVNGVNISTYYLPISRNSWSGNALEYGSNALTLFSKTFGEYPYNSFNVVEEHTQYGGMEYPCQVYITGDYPDYLESIIVHETAHQWWYNLVHNDEVDQGFLDEGLVEWSVGYYGEKHYNSWEYFQGSYSYLDRVRNYYTNYERASKINQSVYEFSQNDMDYWFVAYRKTPLILQKLRFIVGNETFIKSLGHYFEKYKYSIVFLSDFQASIEEIYGEDLNWFFLPWFNNNYLPKYSFKEVKFDQESSNLTFVVESINQDLNDFEYSQEVPLQIYDSANNIIYDKEIWINGTQKISLSLSESPKEIRLVYNEYVLVQFERNQDPYLSYTMGAVYGFPIISLIFFLTIIISLTILFFNSKVNKKESRIRG
ncbi:MAG: hypothetical protein BAJALOKI2v1_130010 [Promethearchaeota archaeon]|nr:MAG: hypothetical protein BAJALOKI2v1_130010 [Candidatus Lokiarchaeota archaeon]